jgi:[ribosomal protein S18]-alanine N-acetyltransferase
MTASVAQRLAQFRPATLDDIPAIMAIELASFSSPWPEEAMIEELDVREWSRVRVVDRGGAVVGFMIYWVVVDELHLLNLAVHPDHRREGVAGLLVAELIEAARKERCRGITLEVRTRNTPARKLYERAGFLQAGLRRGYYADSGEDAVIMWRDTPAELKKPCCTQRSSP